METKTCSKCEDTKIVSEFAKNKTKKDGLQNQCKRCHNQATANWYVNNRGDHLSRTSLYKKENPIDHNRNTKTCNESEGWCVYKVTFPSGIYIGSGKLVARRYGHLNGSTNIAKTLGEKAISFEILGRNTKSEVERCEAALISVIGLDNLLNTRTPRPKVA